MKKILLIFNLCLLLHSPVFALLPPLYESMREMEAILKDPRLGQLLHSGEVIIGIEKSSTGYTIITNQHRLDVTVVYQHDGRIGPQSFSLTFGTPTANE